MRAYKQPNRRIIAIVKRRIQTLLDEAENAAKEDQERANRYLIMARKLAMKHKVRMPYGSSRRFCRKCNTFWVPGKNVRIRTRDGHQVYLCLECKNMKRFPYRKEKSN